MIKSLKSKMAVGLIATGLVAGMGTAFAAQGDAGTQLQSWYNSAKDVAFNVVTGQVTKYAQDKLPALTTEYNGIKNNAVSTVGTAATTETNSTNASINAAKDGHIAAINSAEQQIKDGMPAQFDTYVNSAQTVINQGAIQAEAYAENDVKNAVNSKQTQAAAALETSVNGTKQAAVTALTNEIATTKSALEAALATEKSAAKEEIIAALNSKIEDLRKQLTAYTNGQVSTATTAIENKGADLETKAISELDALVNGITAK